MVWALPDRFAQVSATTAVREVAAAAAEAGAGLRVVSDAAISSALRAAANRLRGAHGPVLAANAADVEAAQAAGMSTGLLDRLRLDPARLDTAARALDDVAALIPEPSLTFLRNLPGGEAVYQRRLPVGVVAATYEARPAVTLDVASQVLRARSAAVLRTGRAALQTSALLVDQVLVPALVEVGLPAEAVGLVRHPGHEAAEALVSQPDLLPLVIVRGSGATTRTLSAVGAAHGVRVLAHADGGGILYADEAADPLMLGQLIEAGLDRMGVCNRLNLLLVHRRRWEELLPQIQATLRARGVAASLPPHRHPLGWEWALDGEHEATVTVAPVDGATAAAKLGMAETSGIAATVCTTDPAAAAEFLAAWAGTGGFWNVSTRLLDGYKLLGVPETGISVDRVPGPRGPVTAADLVLRQYLVVPAGAPPPPEFGTG